MSFPQEERARAFAALGTVIAVAAITGPLLGGVLLAGDMAGLRWRPIFLINILIGTAALLAASRWVEGSKVERQERLDIPGVLLVAGSLFALIWPLSTRIRMAVVGLGLAGGLGDARVPVGAP